MKRFLSFFICLALALLVCLAPLNGLGDVGDFGGDSDYGGGDSGGSDWGSSSDDDYYYYGGSSSDSSDGEGGWGGLLIGAIVIIIIVIVSMKQQKNKKTHVPGAQRTDDAALRPMNEYTALDPAFDEAALRDKLSNWYVQMQNEWQKKDLTPMRPYFADTLYGQLDRQLDTYRTQRKTNYIERIAVLGVTLRGFKQVGDEDHIIVELRTRIVDYTLDDETKKLLSGDQKAERFMTYEWDLSRSSGIQTGVQAEQTVVHCPSCGAPVSINQSAKCPYCDSVITLDTHEWVICGMKGLSQRTAK